MYTVRNSNLRGFSLVEVVVAVGIFALAIVGVIGLLSPTTKAVGDVADSDAASRVVNIVQAELQALAQQPAKTTAPTMPSGWDQLTIGANSILRLAAQVTTYDGLTNPDYATLPYVFFASKDGSIVGPYSSTKWDGGSQTDEDSRKFFEIILIRNWNPTASPPSGLSDPANDATSGYLAYTIRLRWPAYLPNGVRVTDNSQKNVMIVPAAVTR